MASLQESVICSLTLGRGSGNYITNTVFGCCAGSTNTKGQQNSSIGYKAGGTIYASYNVSLGYKAGFGIDYGANNVIVGSLANSNSNTDIANSVIIGKSAGLGYQKGSVGIGVNSLSGGTSNATVALGMNTLTCGTKDGIVAVGHRAGQYNTGCFGVFVGGKAGYYAYGNCSIAVGFNAGNQYNNTNSVHIGYNNNYLNGTSNIFVLGDGNAYGYVCAAWTVVSDLRDKTNVENLPDNLGLNFIRKLRPVSFKFDYRDDYMYKCGFEYGIKDGTLKKNGTVYGFLAQEVEQAAKDLNVNFDGVIHNEFDEKYRLKTLELLSPIIKSIQELNNELDSIEEKIK